MPSSSEPAMIVFLENNRDFDCDIPIFYASAKEGYAMTSMDDEPKDLTPLLDFFATDYLPSPKTEEGDELRLLVTNLTYSSYLGQQVIGRITKGKVTKRFKSKVFLLLSEIR